MSSGNIQLILILLISIIFSAVFLVIYYLRVQFEKQIRDSSHLLRYLSGVNAQYQLPTRYSSDLRYVKHCSSKAEFDRTDLYSFFCECAYENKEKILVKSRAINSYNERMNDYKHEIDSLSRFSDLYLPSERAHKREMELFYQNLLPDVLSFNCIISKQYTSPQGRNSYYIQEIYSMNEAITAISNFSKNMERSNSYRRFTYDERTKMTNSLRYDIMKRDGFRCQICGATSADGVKLHVDHIVPVSKGGKTEYSNLRTLCMRCNSGKRDKYDPYGMN